ncbi:MAG: redox-regulated ATPase YchF [Candidatus Portnoybacteria bacterium CG10_big_fil_rev_8_21_14_0_10_36_7]|uniref:Ribosome-binding ATPase YchF n=1 Tax=Candidatus Portnoybacteria bacterium CG10_big_fil_rev_8_21_14_0_10_36_7 TaxID=1974812 RepID=A0A2M8KDI4_9BACT|nr:MAG: redox-regulated ATPase YchF [Candidatus Portnoybacteria bacterium CG10_big_fil_rev_8_21_14_0_10_36_7]
MSFAIGIVGLPNVGKSTLFKAITRKQIDIANYPFCTIEPNVGIVSVPDTRIDTLQKLMQPSKVTPTIIEFVDIAGLVKGANQGEGLGNQFLTNIREVDAICQVIRIFKNENVIHVEKNPDPKRDIETINTELALKDIDTITKRLDKVAKESKSGDKDKIKETEILQASLNELNNGRALRDMPLATNDPAYKRLFAELGLLTAKPMIYAFNEDSVTKELNLPIDGLIEGENYILLDAKLENELNDLTVDEISQLGLASSSLDRLIKACYDVLNLITFFTGGKNVELKAWTITKGTKASQAAGKIHSDIERGFIKAEIISFSDFEKTGSEAKSRDLGLMRQEGKEYVMIDGDIANFKFNV